MKYTSQIGPGRNKSMGAGLRNKLPHLIVLLLGLSFIVFFYGNILKDPDNYIFSASGDGIKNYFTYAYHIRHDSSYTNLEGMNYPYGENYLYTDCHPVLANTLKCLSSIIPFFGTHSIGLLNLLMIFSILLTFIIVYLLLHELKINKWISIIFSLGITALSPQLFRMTGHLALSYSLAIPLTWWLTIMCIQKSRKYLFVLLFLNNLFWTFIHAYLGMIAVAFSFSILLVKIISDKDKRAQLHPYVWLGMGIILPVLFFYSYLSLVDTHIGRTGNPSGFFLYNAELDDILVPSGKPFRPLLDKLTGGVIKLEWEARGYIGMINTLFFISLIIIAIASLFTRKAKNILKKFFSSKLVNISLIAAIIVLLFAFAIPFKQFPGLLEIFPVLRQFRATGRFVYPFYFAFTVFAAYAFQATIIEDIKNKKSRIAGLLLLISYAVMQSVEAFYYHDPVSKSISASPNLFDKEQVPEYFKKAIDTINPGDYQAIVSIPFYYQGSESYSRPRQEEAVRNSLLFSYHTGIPNVCADLTRTSVEESKRIVQMVSPNYYYKNIINDIKSRKKFLIIKTGNNSTPYEKIILNKAKPVYYNDQLELLEISYEELFSDDSPERLEAYREQLPDLIRQDSFYVTKASPVLYYENFENTKSDTVFRGHGSYKSTKKGKNTFAEFAPYVFEKGKDYDLSVWMFNGEQDALNLWFRLIVEEYDEENGRWFSTVFFPEQAEVIDNDWSLVEGTFRVNDPKNKIYIVSKGKEDSRAALHIDDLLIKESGIDVYRVDREENALFFNNHKIRLQ